MTDVIERADPPAAHLAPPHQGPSRRWMAVFTAALVVVILLAAALTYVGMSTVRDSRAGRRVATITDPALPGYEAFLEPTPTLLLLHTSGRSILSVVVIGLHAGDQGGSVVLVPASTRLGDGASAVPLDVASSYGPSLTGAQFPVQELLGVGIDEVVEVDDARWAELVAPVAPLAIDNPVELPGFAAGPLSLTAEQVGPYLAARGEGESAVAPLERERIVLEAWFGAVASSGDPRAAVPGEVDSGIGRFVRALAAGPREIAALPVVETSTGAGPQVDVDEDAAAALIASAVPFPTAAHVGGRTRVRLLDGTGDREHVAVAAPLIVPAGSEIVVVGNADRFDYTETQIRYHHPLQKRAAEAIRDALGAGRVVDDARQTDAFDVTIVLGPDV